MYYSYVEIEYIATSFSPARTDLALKLSTSLFSFYAMALPLNGWQWWWPMPGGWTAGLAAAAAAYVAAVEVAVVVAPLFGGWISVEG